MRASKPAIWLFIAIAVYSLGQLLWYWQTPLGQMPVLDGQENLIIADTLADGSLEREPFFRAILYPAILALLPVHWMPLGLLYHLANAGLAYRIARKLWTNRIGAAVTAGLVGFNPVMLHFAFDPLDTLFSISLFLVALNLAAPDPSNPKPFEAKRYFWAGLAIALATLARPHFLALLLPAVLYASYLAIARANYRNAAASFALASVFPLIAFGVYQKIRNDSFAILPTQGAYNLWANNRPGANGLYLTQSLNFHYVGDHQNPTKLESAALYMQETGSAGTIEERGAYWRSKAIDHILENPTDWFSLMGFKLYAWLNNVEQYNNKTYAFHKELSPWLRYNPIGWGLLLLGAAFALPALLSQNRSRAIAGLSIVALYSGAALLYMASSRLRMGPAGARARRPARGRPATRIAQFLQSGNSRARSGNNQELERLPKRHRTDSNKRPLHRFRQGRMPLESRSKKRGRKYLESFLQGLWLERLLLARRSAVHGFAFA